MLKRLHDSSNLPWIVGIDFNEIMFDMEKLGGRPKRQKKMIDFKTTLSLCHLIDIGFSGDKYTWKRRDKKGEMIKERLDRFVASSSLIDKMQIVEVEHLNYHNSDHRPIVASLTLRPETKGKIRRHKKPKFEDSWVNFDDCKKIVKDIWNKGQSFRARKIILKTEECMLSLFKWNKSRLKGTTQKAVDRKSKEIRDLE